MGTRKVQPTNHKILSIRIGFLEVLKFIDKVLCRQLQINELIVLQWGF